MGEIKSTWELVMEKTRNLSLNDEERRKQQESEFRKRLNGLIQQYLDEALSVERFLEKSNELQAQCEVQDNHLLPREMLSRLQLDSHHAQNERFLRLLSAYGVKVGELEKVMTDFVAATQKQIAARQIEAVRILAEKFKISGEAVNPYLAADPTLKRGLTDLARSYGQRFEQERRKLAAG